METVKKYALSFVFIVLSNMLSSCTDVENIPFNNVDIVKFDSAFINLNFENVEKYKDWDQLILYSPYANPEKNRNYKIGSFTRISDLSIDDSHYIFGFLLKDSIQFYIRVPRHYNFDKLLSNQNYVIINRGESQFSMELNEHGFYTLK